jgi:hypothetical protein
MARGFHYQVIHLQSMEGTNTCPNATEIEQEECYCHGKEKMSFNEDGLRKVAGTQLWQISINGNIHVINFSLNSLYVHFPDYSIKPSWDVTRSHHYIDPASLYSTKLMWWAFLGHENAITFLHIDCEGGCTEVLVADGGKL